MWPITYFACNVRYGNQTFHGSPCRSRKLAAANKSQRIPEYQHRLRFDQENAQQQSLGFVPESGECVFGFVSADIAEEFAASGNIGCATI